MFSQLKEKITQFVDVYIKLFKINLIGKTAGLLSYFMFALIAMFILFCIMLFMGFGITEAIMLAGVPKVGAFFITVGLYFLLLFLIVALRKHITGFFANTFIKVLTEDAEEKSEKEDDKD